MVHPSVPQVVGRREYRSFGVHTEDFIPGEQVAHFVRVTKPDHLKILRKTKGDDAATHGEIQRLLIRKTLRALRQLARKKQLLLFP